MSVTAVQPLATNDHSNDHDSYPLASQEEATNPVQWAVPPSINDADETLCGLSLLDPAHDRDTPVFVTPTSNSHGKEDRLRPKKAFQSFPPKEREGPKKRPHHLP